MNKSCNVQIGEELKKQLSKGYDIAKISNWAYDFSLNMRNELTPHLQDILRRIYLMDAGPEFVYSEKELNLLAEKLINNERNPHKTSISEIGSSNGSK